MALKKQMTSIKNIQITEKGTQFDVLKANFMINSYPHNMEITTF